MRALVTGAAGFIGSNFVRRLLATRTSGPSTDTTRFIRRSETCTPSVSAMSVNE